MIFEDINNGLYNSILAEWIKTYLFDHYKQDKHSNFILTVFDSTCTEKKSKIVSVNIQNPLQILEITLNKSLGQSEYCLSLKLTFGLVKQDSSFGYTINDCIFNLHFDIHNLKTSLPHPYDIEFGYNYFHWLDDKENEINHENY